MTGTSLPAWFERVRLHPDVESGKFTRATFAIDFGGILGGDPKVPLVYKDGRAFWSTTHLTTGLRRLLDEVLAMLAGGDGDRVLQLRSPFGGGKSHVLAALYHAVKDRSALLASVPEAAGLPDPGAVRFAGVDGEKFDPLKGMEVAGRHVRTLWGAIASQLGCFDLVADHERSLTAPGGEIVKTVLGASPTLILLDEVLRYVERAYTIAVGESNLGRQTLEFLQTLTTEVAGSEKAVLVYSLQASEKEAFDNVGLLSMLDHLTSRVDAKREPVAGDEVLHVVKKRLLAASPPVDSADAAAGAIANSVTRWRLSEAPDDAARRQAQDDEVVLRSRLREAYPFHVGLIDLMKERWASMPDFQRTRGALRFLATVLHRSKALGRRSAVVGPGDVPIDDPEVLNAFFSELGLRREQFKSVLEHDFIGPNARTVRIDRQLQQQNPELAGVRPARRLATAILMYSFGGAPYRNGAEPLPPGVTERELLEVCLSPDLDPITAQTALKRLREECLYLHFDGVRYCFKTIPNVNLILEQEAENVKQEEIRRFVHEELQRSIAQAGRNAWVWPEGSRDIPDEPRFLVVYLPLEFAEMPDSQREEVALELLTNHGDRPRNYRRGIVLAVPDPAQLAGIRRAAKYLLAARRVREKRASYKLTKEQLDQLQERERTEQAALGSGLRSLYTEVWLLRQEDGRPALLCKTLRSRPLQAQGIHERIVEFLKGIEGIVSDTVKPHKIREFLGTQRDGTVRMVVEIAKLREYYFGAPDAPVILTDQSVLQQAVAQGVKEGLFAYALRDRVRDESGTPRVKEQDVAFSGELSADEVDLDRGCVLLPECVERTEPGPQTGPDTGEGKQGVGGVVIPKPPDSTRSRTVSISMRVTKTQLFKTFNPLSNLAERAGKIRVVVQAEHPDGFDRNWLRNAVKEPLEEMDIEVEEFHEEG
jgi:hypothetical protein